ncbi:MAG TPA: hypothetical protein VK753_00940 [Xanthomonadaceae bacterium]|jgi:hypothetical protein|nr:hypothetical protein [Xanthomonadaceae bacterium]
MTRKFWNDLAPSLLLAGGIVAGQAAQAAWSDLAGTSVLAFSVLAADGLAAKLRGMSPRPSLPAWILVCAFTLAGGLALLREPGHTGSLIPLLGLGAWTTFFMPGGDRRKPRALPDRISKEPPCSRC